MGFMTNHMTTTATTNTVATIVSAIQGIDRLNFVALGQIVMTQAFAFLNKGFDERDFVLVMLKTEPMFDPLRSDPRFAVLARRVGLPE